MEAIRQSNATGTIQNDIPAQVALATRTIYPLLERRRNDIQGIARETYQYGTHLKHEMDVYYPYSTPSGKAPVVVFVHGGGYQAGTKSLPPPADVIYANVGAFYASQGFVAVIPDYRKLPDGMKWPDAPSDIASALTFLTTHASEVNLRVPTKADVQNIFLTGHSAGGAIVSDMLLAQGVLPEGIRPHIRGLVIFGGVMHYRNPDYPISTRIERGYYGSEAEVRTYEPLALLENASDEVVRDLPDVLLLVSEYEVDVVRASVIDFRAKLVERTGKDVPLLTAKDHNHISAHYALFSGEGEDWGHDVVGWMKDRVTSNAEL